jgi:antitoxin (DNA-binding transcriptional repressor) of toxin-antitoxin stability system
MNQYCSAENLTKAELCINIGLSLAEKAWAGETVVIAKAGKPYLDLLPHKVKREPRKPGRFKGQIQVPHDFNLSSEESIAAFEGDN